MNLKEIGKMILYVVIVIASIVTIALFLDDDGGDGGDNFQAYMENTNFPLDSYIYHENKKPSILKLYDIEKNSTAKEDVREVDSITQKFENLRKDLLSNKYSSNIFESDEEIIKNKEEKNINNVLNYRVKNMFSISISHKIKSVKPKELDFGADKFSNLKESDKASNESKMYRTITANKRIPAMIIEPIDSTLDGEVTAQIEEDIYSYIGNTLLIPKGSQAIGSYISNTKAGANRFNILWRRILTPHGININLTGTLTTDMLGNSGAIGELDNKYWKRYGLPLTLSTISNGLLLAIANMDSKNKGNNNNTKIVLDNSRQDLSYIMKSIIDEQIKIKPRITIQAGSRIFIKPKIDIWFPKPRNGEIMVRYFKAKTN